MSWFKKVLTALFLGITVFALTGCGGKDLSGLYMMDMGDKHEFVRVLDVKKGDKGGYIINYKFMHYKVVAKYGEGGTIASVWAPVGTKSHLVKDIIATWEENSENTFITSAPNKDSNKMTYKDTKNMGFLTGVIAIDEDGSLIDETGGIINDVAVKKGTKFKKIKELNVEEIKKTLQEHVTANAHAEYDYDRPLEDSKIGKIVFKDEKK